MVKYNSMVKISFKNCIKHFASIIYTSSFNPPTSIIDLIFFFFKLCQMQRSLAFFQWEWKVTKQETTKLQSQHSNYNKKQNRRKVERCGSHHFEEDKEATMGDSREKKSSASAFCPLPPVCES